MHHNTWVSEAEEWLMKMAEPDSPFAYVWGRYHTGRVFFTVRGGLIPSELDSHELGGHYFRMNASSRGQGERNIFTLSKYRGDDTTILVLPRNTPFHHEVRLLVHGFATRTVGTLLDVQYIEHASLSTSSTS